MRVWPPPKLLPSVARCLALAVTSLALIAHIVLLIHLGDAERPWLDRAWAGGFGVWILGPFLAPLALLVATERISGAWITAGVLLIVGDVTHPLSPQSADGAAICPCLRTISMAISSDCS